MGEHEVQTGSSIAAEVAYRCYTKNGLLTVVHCEVRFAAMRVLSPRLDGGRL